MPKNLTEYNIREKFLKNSGNSRYKTSKRSEKFFSKYIKFSLDWKLLP